MTIPDQPEGGPSPSPEPTPAESTPAIEPKKERRWVLPTVVGVLALFAGVAIGQSDAGETETGTSPEPAATVTVGPDADRVAALEEREAAVTAQEAELTERENEVAARELAVGETEAEIEENTIPGDGIFLVGDDIKPGQYRSEAADCYWARLSGTSGEFEDIIANGNGAAIVTIAESDHAFESRFCDVWTLVQ